MHNYFHLVLFVLLKGNCIGRDPIIYKTCNNTKVNVS